MKQAQIVKERKELKSQEPRSGLEGAGIGGPGGGGAPGGEE